MPVARAYRLSRASSKPLPTVSGYAASWWPLRFRKRFRQRNLRNLFRGPLAYNLSMSRTSPPKTPPPSSAARRPTSAARPGSAASAPRSAPAGASPRATSPSSSRIVGRSLLDEVREDRLLALAARSDSPVRTRESTWTLALGDGRTIQWFRQPTAAEVRQARASTRLSVAEAARLVRRDAR